MTELRLAWRTIRRNAWFSTAVVMTLALGIGSNTAIFSIFNGIVLRPLPYKDPASLVTVLERQAVDAGRGVTSAANFTAWSESTTIRPMGAFRPWGFVLSGRGEAERLVGARVSQQLFHTLNVQAIAGRTFLPDEDRPGGRRVVLVSERLWEQRLDRTADLGNSRTRMTLNGDSYEVIGVLSREFKMPEADVWTPLALEPFTLQQRTNRFLTVVGRLEPGRSLAQANEEMHSIATRLAAESPDANRGWSVAVVPLSTYVVGGASGTLTLVWAAVGLVLLIACANTANLMLARVGGRRREVALSFALGASRGRIVRRVLAESLILACLGGAAGIPLAMAGLGLLRAFGPPDIPRIDSVGLDVTALAFTTGLSAVTGLLFGLIPAVRGSRSELSLALNDARLPGDGGQRRLSHVALAAQMTLAAFVLIAAGLLLRSLDRVLAVDVGFDGDRVLVATASLPDAKYGTVEKRTAFFDDLLRRVRATPGIHAAGLMSHLPLGGRPLTSDFTIAGRPASAPSETLWADCASIAGDLFDAVGMRVLRGRGFSDDDRRDRPAVVIINDAMARRFWPDGSAIGQHIVLGSGMGAAREPREIVGVVSDVRSVGVEVAPPFQVYVPYAQTGWPTMSLAVRADGDPARVAAPIRAAVAALDPDQAAYGVRPLAQILDRANRPRRFQTVVVAVFAGLGLLLAMTGIYSVVTYTVRQRATETAVRVALGAQAHDVLLLMAGETLIWAISGVALGGMLALWAGRAFGGVLYGVTPADPLTFALVLGLTATMAAAGSLLAGWRAVRVDPLVSLRRS